MKKVYFHSADKRLDLRERTRIQRFVEAIFRREKIRLGAVHYIFCSDEYLLRINRDFLQHDYYTDIISFGLSEPGSPVEAEVYISLDRIKDNAKTLGLSGKSETLRVIFHGALHLCGYRDKKKSEITVMRKKEDHYLRSFEKFLDA